MNLGRCSSGSVPRGEPREQQRGATVTTPLPLSIQNPKDSLIAVARVQERAGAPYDAPVLVRQRLT